MKHLSTITKPLFTITYSQKKILLVVALFLLLAILSWKFMGVGDDWRYTFRPATVKLLTGEDPYGVDQFMIAPWVFIYFIPLGLLPESLGNALLFISGLLAYTYVAYKLDAKPLGLVAILLSPQILHNFINSNIDWLAFLGFVLPPNIG